MRHSSARIPRARGPRMRRRSIEQLTEDAGLAACEHHRYGRCLPAVSRGTRAGEVCAGSAHSHRELRTEPHRRCGAQRRCAGRRALPSLPPRRLRRSLPRAPAPQPAARQAAAGERYGVQLGAIHTQVKAQSQWQRLNARFGARAAWHRIRYRARRREFPRQAHLSPEGETAHRGAGAGLVCCIAKKRSGLRGLGAQPGIERAHIGHGSPKLTIRVTPKLRAPWSTLSHCLFIKSSIGTPLAISCMRGFFVGLAQRHVAAPPAACCIEKCEQLPRCLHALRRDAPSPLAAFFLLR